MGYFITEFVVGIVDELDDNKEERWNLDKFLKQRGNKRFFAKSERQNNGTFTYVMFYDGSKEGWETSNKANALREQFIALLRAICYTKIYHVKHPEDQEKPTMEYIKGRDLE